MFEKFDYKSANIPFFFCYLAEHNAFIASITQQHEDRKRWLSASKPSMLEPATDTTRSTP
jgi:hypothetical protein